MRVAAVRLVLCTVAAVTATAAAQQGPPMYGYGPQAPPQLDAPQFHAPLGYGIAPPPASSQPLPMPAADAAERVPPGAPSQPLPVPPVSERFQFIPSALVDWDGSIELGINGTEGNAQSFSIRAGGDLSRKTDTTAWKVDITYAKTTSGDQLTQHNALFNAKYELLNRSPWDCFARFGLEYDEFKAFDSRAFLNTGVSYAFAETEITKLAGRAGAGVSHEFGGPNDDYVPESVFGMDFERKIAKRHKLSAVVDYFPDWRDFSDYRLVTNVGWQLALDEAGNLSLKLSLIDRYDSTPEGREPNDFDYAILLLWKL